MNRKPIFSFLSLAAKAGKITSGEFIRIPTDTKEVTEEQRQSIHKLIDKLEEDDDVVNVFHNMKEEDTDAE